MIQYKDIIEKKIQEDLSSHFGDRTKLKEACEYALLNGGKRFRPSIVLMTADALKSENSVLDAALAVEYFHTASLIADDLPCMDDDDLRRNKPSTHIVFGESTALLASYALISAGYRLIAQNARGSDTLCLHALESATYNTGILGATGGQFIDLFPPDDSEETLKEILNKKTVTLFELAFSLGWIYGGGDLDKLDKIKELSYHFGMAFQIADDLDDISQDDDTSVNLARLIGVSKAKETFQEELKAMHTLLKELSLNSQDFLAMTKALEHSVK